MKKFGIRQDVARYLAQSVTTAADQVGAGFFDINHTKSELVSALTRKRTDNSVLLSQQELESALYSAVTLDEDGAWPSDWPPLASLIEAAVPPSHRFDPYFCFILERTPTNV